MNQHTLCRPTSTIALLLICFFAINTVAGQTPHDGQTFQANGIKIGAVTQNQAIIWTRLTAAPELNLPGTLWPKTARKVRSSPLPAGKQLTDMEGASPGTTGSVRVTYWLKSDSQQRLKTKWMTVTAQGDFIQQFHLQNLKPGSSYELEVESKNLSGKKGATLQGKFRTAPTAEQSQSISFTVVTGQDYNRRDDQANGHKIYPLMQNLDPDFFVHTGDIEYYDKPRPFAKTIELARYKMNRLAGLPFQKQLQSNTASYFIKDDHDTLKNDCYPGQTYGELTWEDGLSLFKEQFPIGDKSYRTVRWGKHLQIWIVEGRDFRSNNKAPDGPDKTIWGETQKKWFFKTVTASDATFKILISPTPLVGPDRTGKGDNHANKAFAHEGKQLRKFISQQKNMFICCGDRHWQYVSVHPDSGVREYSCGPTSNKHAGGWSNKNRSEMHKYLNVTGGFLSVRIDASKDKPTAVFRHYGTDGRVLNEDQQIAK